MNYIYYKDYKIEAVYDSIHTALYPVIRYKHNNEIVYNGEFDYMLFHENDVFSEGARIIQSGFLNV